MVSKVYLEWDQIIKPQNFGSKFMHLANKSLKNDVQILIFALLTLLPLQSTVMPLKFTYFYTTN